MIFDHGFLVAKRILIIDQDVSTLIHLQEYLKTKDYIIYTAENERSGFSILNAVGIEGVFISFDIPKLNGLRVLNHLRTQFPKIPFIAMSSKVTQDIVKKSFACGAKGYIAKPIVYEQVQETLFIFEGHLC